MQHRRESSLYLFEPNFHRLCLELTRTFFAQDQPYFVLPMAFKAFDKSKFTQSFAWMKFWLQRPNLCRVGFALLAREQNSRTCSTLSVHIANSLGRVKHTTSRTQKQPSLDLELVVTSITFRAPTFLDWLLLLSKFCTKVRLRDRYWN